jgi:hypothetical protein
MKAHQILLLTLGFSVIASRTDASTLYGSTSAGGAGELWTINPANGASVLDVGALNDSIGNNYAVTGLAFDPLTGVLYGSTGGVSGTKLLTLNPATAAVTVVGSFTASGGTMSDLAFDSAGNLYGISASGGANLYTINLSTGASTKVGTSGVSFTQGGGLAISPGGTFYASPINTDFGTYNSTTGVFTDITNPVKPGGSATSYGSLAFDGSTLYGMNLATPTHLVTIDAAGNVTDLGTSVAKIDGIAFQPDVVPEPTTLALCALGGAMTFLAARRKVSRTAKA